VRAGSVSGFPYGFQTTAAKLFETRDLLRRGAKEIDAVVATSKLLSREFQHVQTELSQLAEACRQEGATLKVILETAHLTDELKIIACRCCERAEVDFVAGYTLDDFRLLRKYLPEEIQIKAAGDLRTVDEVLAAYEAGCSRIVTTSAPAILDEWKTRLAPVTE
jgi:deoxyribose-phosphate aldolase